MKSINQHCKPPILFTTKIVLILMLLIGFSCCWGQNHYSYYILERAGHSLEPTSKVSNSNGTINLTFSSSSLNSFFQTKTVYKYEKAFPSTSIGNYLYRVYEVTLSDQNLVTDLSSLTEIELAEEVPIEYPAYDPDDPQYGVQNNLTTQLGLVRAPKAWDISHGNPTVVIGILDDNFDTNHEDLKFQILQHFEDNNNPQHHGTKVAGMVGAETNNGKGIAAIGFNIKLITKEFNGTNGANKLLELAQIPGVRVLNYSWGGCNYSTFQAELYRQIRQDHDVLLLACAGNGAGWHCVNDSEQYVYPASYDHVVSVSSVGHLNYIGVGNSNWKDVHERVPGNPNTSHQHNDKVDLVAPGYNVRTTYPNSSYGTPSGTSFATPMVAGAAGLVLSVKPDLTADQLESILKATADDIYCKS